MTYEDVVAERVAPEVEQGPLAHGAAEAFGVDQPMGEVIAMTTVIVVFVGIIAGGINNRIDDVNANVNSRIDDLNDSVNNRFNDVNSRIDDVNTSVNSRIDDLNTNLNRWTDDLQNEMRELRALVIDAGKDADPAA